MAGAGIHEGHGVRPVPRLLQGWREARRADQAIRTTLAPGVEALVAHKGLLRTKAVIPGLGAALPGDLLLATGQTLDAAGVRHVAPGLAPGASL